jgi:hypothetical protein
MGHLLLDPAQAALVAARGRLRGRGGLRFPSARALETCDRPSVPTGACRRSTRLRRGGASRRRPAGNFRTNQRAAGRHCHRAARRPDQSDGADAARQTCGSGRPPVEGQIDRRQGNRRETRRSQGNDDQAFKYQGCQRHPHECRRRANRQRARSDKCPWFGESDGAARSSDWDGAGRRRGASRWASRSGLPAPDHFRRRASPRLAIARAALNNS